jgi:predicted nuclease of predicted toxin-antitoxin system
MKFLVDAQLPARLKSWLVGNGYDAIHTDDLPERNLTADLTIAAFADQENRIVISKDSDFLKLRILQNKPQKLLMITTGNIVNKELLVLFERNFVTALKLFNTYDVVELNNHFVIGHTIN